MARTRSFDEAHALGEAMKLFWAKGYVETSYDDLVKGTGVSRKSLYAAFGEKRSLYAAALEHYRATVVPRLLAPLANEALSIDDIKALFRTFVDLAVSEGGRNGCLIVNTSNDETINDPDVKKVVEAHHAYLHEQFGGALERSGYGRERRDALAHYLVGVFQGLLTLAHARAGRGRIEPFIEEAMKALD